MSRNAFALLLTAGLIACSSTHNRPVSDPIALKAYQQRQEELSGLSAWTLDGRLAISDGQEAGSGRLLWSQDPLLTEISFRGTLGKGAWQIHADESSARLETASGEQYVAESLAELVRSRVGWKVPVDALIWWVKGLAGPGRYQALRLDADGRPEVLDQGGWLVEFDGWKAHEGHWLPVKLAARQGRYVVKLAIRDWELKGE